MKRVTVNVQSRAAYDCFRIATSSLELAIRAQGEWEIKHHCVTGVTFTAFAIEAMLNHYGRIYFPDWNDDRQAKRKCQHKKLFKCVNLPNYLGSKNYQDAEECFEFRDFFAHGKTCDDSFEIEFSKSHSDRDILRLITSTPSLSFRDVNLALLERFVGVARSIQLDIENNGYYPVNEDVPEECWERLSECPLDVTGTYTW